MTRPRIRPIPSTVTTVNLETGEETTEPMNWGLMPPPADACQVCAVKHDPREPHNAQSLYYQMAFHAATGRYPTWADAIAHCSSKMQKAWKGHLSSFDGRNHWTEPPEGVAAIAHLGEEVKAE